MNMGRWCTAMVMLALAPASCMSAAPALPGTGPITIRGDHLSRSGEPYQLISGSMQFQRIPRAYWRDRLRKARAMGLNAIETYVFWNAVEPRRGHYDFSGRNDVAAFVR